LIIALCAGVLCLRPDRGLLALASSDSAGARTARQLIPAMIVLPSLFGWACLEAQRAGWFGADAAIALFAITNVVAFVALGWSTAESLHRADSERRAAEAALKVHSDRIAIASEAAGHGFWAFDIAANTVRWDKQMFHNYGRPIAEGDQPYAVWAESLHPEDRARTEALLADAIADKQPFDTDFRIIRASGQIRHIRTLARVMREPDGRAIRVFGVSFDITQQKQAEAATARALQRMHNAQRIAQVGDWEYDLDTKAITWSAQVFEIFGRNPRLGPPRSLSEIVAAHDPSSGTILERSVARVIETGEATGRTASRSTCTRWRCPEKTATARWWVCSERCRTFRNANAPSAWFGKGRSDTASWRSRCRRSSGPRQRTVISTTTTSAGSTTPV
jgi:PAS domain-containing protein